MEQSEFLELMQRLCPLELAEDWDNVGLLLAPSEPRAVQRVLLTVDLTSLVLDEALEFGAQAIVAYHPPIFSGVKRLLPDEPASRMLLRVIEHGVLIYSPHTALDAVPGGVNDWLASAFPFTSKRAIEPNPLAPAEPATGQGRLLELSEALTLQDAVLQLKTHLGVDALRIAAPGDLEREISSVALAAGAGGSVVTKARADLYVTGEMRHHDVLAAVGRGTSVILSEHTHTERGYLPRLCDQLTQRAALEVRVSRRDASPLSFV